MADVSGLGAKNVEGPAAHDSAVDGNPLLSGGEARTTLPTAVGDGDAVRAMHDDLGRQVNYPYAPRDRITHNTITLTSTTETTLIAAAASTFKDLVYVHATNTSGTAVRVDFKDSDAGTVRFSIYLAANGGGAVMKFPVPVTQSAVNNNWRAQLSAAVTDVRIFAIAVDNN